MEIAALPLVARNDGQDFVFASHESGEWRGNLPLAIFQNMHRPEKVDTFYIYFYPRLPRRHFVPPRKDGWDVFPFSYSPTAILLFLLQAFFSV
ncbi:MAG: hypothetical protein ABH869_05865 [Candidatus Omnitrophota bacterium]